MRESLLWRIVRLHSLWFIRNKRFWHLWFQKGNIKVSLLVRNSIRRNFTLSLIKKNPCVSSKMDSRPRRRLARSPFQTFHGQIKADSTMEGRMRSGGRRQPAPSLLPRVCLSRLAERDDGLSSDGTKSRKTSNYVQQFLDR